MEAGEVDTRLRYQGGHAGDEVEWFEDDMGGAVPVRCLERIAHISLTCQSQAFDRYRRTGDIAAQPLQLSPLVGFDGELFIQTLSGTAQLGLLIDGPVVRDEPDPVTLGNRCLSITVNVADEILAPSAADKVLGIEIEDLRHPEFLLIVVDPQMALLAEKFVCCVIQLRIQLVGRKRCRR